MTFSSYTFLIFIVVVFALHRALPTFRAQKINLTIAGFVFYAAWNPPFVLLLMMATVVDWFLARAIAASEDPRQRRLWLTLSLCSNLGMLAFFKYSNFLLQNFIALAHSVGIEYAPPAFDIILPIGISFYTFQTLSYTMDVYRRDMPPAKTFLDYALFVGFFPQLVAGPIVRASDFLPQCEKARVPTSSELGWGIHLFLLGLFQKIVVADGLLAPIVERVFDSQDAPSALGAWAATLAFAVQVFADFAGYSSCAIGLALLFGFSLPDNFRAPYAAIGFSDFWRRWHISLSTWLRDYLYISLGGSRRGAWRTNVNLLLTMVLGGLWHGASWNFVTWGTLHGLFLAGERSARARFGQALVWTRWPAQLVLTAGTFLLVCLTWIFFRAPTHDRSLGILAAAVGLGQPQAGNLLSHFEIVLAVGVTAAMLAAHRLMRDQTLEDLYGRTPGWLRIAFVAGMTTLIFMSPGEDRAFIYFQF